MRYAVFMAGGRGERFWPMSRASTPKHLLPLFEDKTLMQLSVERLSGFIPTGQVYVVTSAPQAPLMRSTLAQLSPAQVFVEPVARDTAAAVALAARIVQQANPNAVMAMLPADHFISAIPAFQQTLDRAFAVAEKSDTLVTIGIPPTRPATGYGYLHKGPAISSEAFAVQSFKEKPDAATALRYLQSGQYFWNAGIFVWSVKSIISAFQAYAPDIWSAVAAIDPSNPEQLNAVYPTLRKTSVDYAIMEHAKNVITVPAGFDWDDVGEWTALERLSAPDSASNTTIGNTLAVDSTQNTLVNSQPEHLLATLGVSGLVVVHTAQATLVMPKEKAQELKKLLKTLSENEALKKFL